VSAFIDGHGERFGVEPICRIRDVSASAYYKRRSGPPSRRAVCDERLLGEIRRVHADNYECYGSRRVWKQSRREGIEAARCMVERLMAEHGIEGAKPRGKRWRTTLPDPAGQDPPDLVERNFTADAPKTITFTHQLGRDGKRHPLKTKRSRRTLEVTPSIIATLRKTKLAIPKSGEHDFVFLSRAGTAHDQRNIGGRVLSRAVKRAGLEAVTRGYSVSPDIASSMARPSRLVTRGKNPGRPFDQLRRAIHQV
jgi:hypothetical protein